MGRGVRQCISRSPDISEKRQLVAAHGNASTGLSAGFTDPHNHYTFSGKEWDEHLDSYEFGYRLYDPGAGVWLTQDPLRGEPSRPRTLHRYQYVFASPISYRDAYGLQVEPPGCELGEICYTGTTGPYNVQSTPYAGTPAGAKCEPTVGFLSYEVRPGTPGLVVSPERAALAHKLRLNSAFLDNFAWGINIFGGSLEAGSALACAAGGPEASVAGALAAYQPFNEAGAMLDAASLAISIGADWVGGYTYSRKTESGHQALVVGQDTVIDLALCGLDTIYPEAVGDIVINSATLVHSWSSVEEHPSYEFELSLEGIRIIQYTGNEEGGQ